MGVKRRRLLLRDLSDLPSPFTFVRSSHLPAVACKHTRAHPLFETLAAARQWLLTVCAKIHSLQPVTASMVPDFVLLGQHKSLHRRRDATAIRGCFFGQWKSQRNLAIKGYARNTTQVCDSLNKRLQAVILRDWVRRRGRGTFAKRWHPFVIVRPGGPEFHNLPSVRDGSVL
eukprot:COSAG01_NODE_2076_length_8486_cov_41.323000_3_plen_172_part_00